MPGVPSGRGCDGCRKQKKKVHMSRSTWKHLRSKPAQQCDQTTPVCSRCARLKIQCIGAGKQRYKFQEEQGMPKVSLTSKCTTPRSSVSASPANRMTVLANRLVNAIKWSTDLRFNLVWSYGIFLTEIPSRLGNNEALDYAVEALVDAHSTSCCLRKPSTANLINYSAALSKLRCCLDDSTKATSSETLAAIVLLLICQVGHCILITQLTLTLQKGHTGYLGSVFYRPRGRGSPHFEISWETSQPRRQVRKYAASFVTRHGGIRMLLQPENQVHARRVGHPHYEGPRSITTRRPDDALRSSRSRFYPTWKGCQVRSNHRLDTRFRDARELRNPEIRTRGVPYSSLRASVQARNQSGQVLLRSRDAASHSSSTSVRVNLYRRHHTQSPTFNTRCC
jgi:hypothetical protein